MVCMYVCRRGGPEIRPLHRDLQTIYGNIKQKKSVFYPHNVFMCFVRFSVKQDYFFMQY
jgi:hypothetical protein